VNGIVHEILALLRGEATRYPIAMRAELTTDLPKIMADRVQLQQVFMNLVLNAIEALTDSGGELTVKSELGNDGTVLISVSDTGVGLPSGNVAEIFSAFFTTKAEGSGMGLAISRSIIESHGGRLWATAKQRTGCDFPLHPATRSRGGGGTRHWNGVPSVIRGEIRFTVTVKERRWEAVDRIRR
jgi:signal transduction histidine kinase